MELTGREGFSLLRESERSVYFVIGKGDSEFFKIKLGLNLIVVYIRINN